MFIHVYDASKHEKFLLFSPLAPSPLSPCTHPSLKNFWILYNTIKYNTIQYFYFHKNGPTWGMTRTLTSQYNIKIIRHYCTKIYITYLRCIYINRSPDTAYIETNFLIVNALKMTLNIGDLIGAEVFFWSTVAKVNLRLFFNNHF